MNPYWQPPSRVPISLTPVLGHRAEEQIGTINERDHGLAKKLTKRIVGLLDAGPLYGAVIVPDTGDIGPRFLIGIGDDYVIVYWVIDEGRSLPTIWVEQVMLGSEAEAMLAELLPGEK